MNRYELLTIFNAALTDEEKELLNVNKWGVKKLAYPINYKKEGFYVLYEFETLPEVPAKISALMNIDENVLRSLCLKKEIKEVKETNVAK